MIDECEGYFKKLPFKHFFDEVENFDAIHPIVDKDNKGIFYGLSNRNLLDLVPEEYKKDFHQSCMLINSNKIPPHIDSDISTVINFYVKTANSTTTFWKTKENFRKRKVGNQTDGYIVHDEDVIEIASFKAEPNEVWILNVKQIHSVESSDTDIQRFANQLQTKLPYEKVLSILNDFKKTSKLIRIL